MKHGALWLDTDEQTGSELVGEYYDRQLDMIGAIFARRGLYLVTIYEKVNDPSWSVPHWISRGPQNWFPSMEHASNYMLDALRAARDGKRTR